MSKKWRLSICVDGDSAKELFAVGVKDLMGFLKDRLNVNPKDVRYCFFEEDLNPDEFFEYLCGERERLVHKDNYFRCDEVE